MAMTQPVHNWDLGRDSWLIRFYVWFIINGPYGQGDKSQEGIDRDLRDLSFCKLFWAVVLAVPLTLLAIALLPILLLLGALVFVAEKISDRRHDKKAEQAERSYRERMNAVPGAAVEKTAGFADRISAWFQRHPGVGKGFHLAGTALLWVLMVGVVVAVFGTAIWAGVSFTAGLVTCLEIFGLSLVAAIVLAGIVLGIAGLIAKTPVGTGLAWVGRKIGGFFVGIGHGFRGVYRFFETGHHAVKTRTCPRVIVHPADRAS